MDILDSVVVMMPCCSCSQQYGVTLKQALLSQEMLHDGCPVSDERECPPLYWSHVADERLARELQDVWQRLEERAAKIGGELKLLACEERASVVHG
ncbi:MAG TPA: hypothetical protein VJ731_00440 [Terriglobales bacterium]|nr:hypothetical protein [Terriglobales bacterium]